MASVAWLGLQGLGKTLQATAIIASTHAEQLTAFQAGVGPKPLPSLVVRPSLPWQNWPYMCRCIRRIRIRSTTCVLWPPAHLTRATTQSRPLPCTRESFDVVCCARSHHCRPPADVLCTCKINRAETAVYADESITPWVVILPP